MMIGRALRGVNRWVVCAAVLGLLSSGAALGADREEPELLPAPRPLKKREMARFEKLRAEAERIRGFKLKRSPPWNKRTRAEIYTYFTRLVNASKREREVKLSTALFAGFGFWKPDFDLVKVQLRAQSGAVGAFYTPEERSFTLVPYGKRRMSRYVRMEKDAQAVHEYTHAIQDQHLGLSKLKMFAGNDCGNAARALVEGDALLTMSVYAVGKRSGRDKESRLSYVTRETARRRAGMRAILKSPAMKRIPRIIGVTMVFPYTGGSLFVERAYKRGGWAAVNRLYSTPPISTEQIMHPEKYFVPKGQPIEDPVEIKLPALKAAGLTGLRRIDEDSLGEMGITVLLSGFVTNARARLAGSGWGGDRYAAYERTAGAKAGQIVISWLSVWDREQDAREFFDAYAKALDTKCGPKRKALDEDGQLLDWRGAGTRRSARLERWGAAVLCIENASAAETTELADLMWTAPRRKPKARYHTDERSKSAKVSK
jgi:hypothetical protein